MGKYVDESILDSRRTVSSIRLTIGIIGFIFWGFVAMSMLLSGDVMGIYVFFIMAIVCGLHVWLGLNGISMKKVNDSVYLYARYFEGDLDGYIYICNMVNVIGKSEAEIYNELNNLLKERIMTNFFIRDFNGKKQIVLESKIAKCECKNCGAIIDKRMYFVGTCPYCHSSDIYAELVK
ncbi:MAG: hypothetical protein IKE91_06360 [Clostridia bacterium]|nr:hypothetical protein [Clostridia bacterium]